MEQTTITPAVSEAVKYVHSDASDPKGIWNLKKQKSKGRNFFSELFKSLSASITKNQPQQNAVKSDSQLKKGTEAFVKGLDTGEAASGIKEKKKIQNLKIDQLFEKNEDSPEKLEKTKEKKKKQVLATVDRGEILKSGQENENRDEKKLSAHSMKKTDAGDVNSQVKNQESDKSKKTIVIDLRKQADMAAAQGTGADSSSQATDTSLASKISGVKGDQIAYFGSSQAAQDAKSKPSSSDKGASLLSNESVRTFQEILKNELVTNTRFVIRDGGSGELQIELKPESLGKLRFKVNIDNNRIDGKIFVENNNARELVEQSVQNLSDALMKEGFESVNIQVSLGGDGRRDVEPGNGYAFTGNRAIELENAVPGIEYVDMGDRLIDMVV